MKKGSIKVVSTSLFEPDKGAVFADFEKGDQAYRTLLWRIWDRGKPCIAYCMLNPSTADHEFNDATVERCERRAKMLRFGKMLVVNLFALRSKRRDNLLTHPEPTGGSHNDQAILKAAQEANVVVLAWGTYGTIKGRDQQVIQLLRKNGMGWKLRHLGLTSDGHPGHPLYVSYETPLFNFKIKA